MSERVDSYRQKAAECERLGRAATDRDAKAAFLETARQWLELALQVEDLERERMKK